MLSKENRLLVIGLQKEVRDLRKGFPTRAGEFHGALSGIEGKLGAFRGFFARFLRGGRDVEQLERRVQPLREVAPDLAALVEGATKAENEIGQEIDDAERSATEWSDWRLTKLRQLERGYGTIGTRVTRRAELENDKKRKHKLDADRATVDRAIRLLSEAERLVQRLAGHDEAATLASELPARIRSLGEPSIEEWSASLEALVAPLRDIDTGSLRLARQPA